LKFYKYHGTGNDFILLDEKPNDPISLAKNICDRHFGIGADGLIYPEISHFADIKFNYYNSDGSLAPMCGNGMRCFVKFLIDQKHLEKLEFSVETLAGLVLVSYDKTSELITIDLGQPYFNLSSPHVAQDILAFKPVELSLDDKAYTSYTVLLGTLHTIIYVDDCMDLSVLGPKLSTHPFFLNQTNINFVTVKDPAHQYVKTFERGAGWTLSCGTGTAASAVVSHKLGHTKRAVLTQVPGGNLKVLIKDTIQLEGPAVKIASGIYEA